MKITTEELIYLGSSFVILVIVVTLLSANVDDVEMVFKIKVDNRWIGY